MPTFIPTAALGAAIASGLALGITLGSVVHAQQGNMDAQMHHQMSSQMQMSPQESAAGSSTDNSFDAQMGRAMERMDKDMMVKPSGSYDRDFAAMMIPHHQGAVDMARVELQFGKDPVLRRLAQAIIVEQLQEIEVMNLELKQLPDAAPVPNPAQHDANQAHHD